MTLAKGIDFYAHWTDWNFGKVMRLNGSMMWGFNPYTSYSLGPFELRVWAWRKSSNDK